MYQILDINIMFATIGLLLLAKHTLQQNFTLDQPATGPSITCQGSDVTLRCVILRNGVAVDPEWRRNGTMVNYDILTNHQRVFNSTYNAFTDLVITNVGLEDDNTDYNCTTVGSDITSSIVLNVTGPTSIETVNVSTSICYASVMWSSSRNEICGPINYGVQFINNGLIVKNLSVTTSEISMISLAPDTNYTFKVAAMDGTGKRIYMEKMFNTGKPINETFTATWQCNETNFCGILAEWTTITETDESCPSIEKLELQGLNASSDNVAVDNALTTTRSYTALIPVDQLINNTVLIATYCNGAVTRSSDQINTIDGSKFLLQALEGEILFNIQLITVKAKWKGATNLGAIYRISLICSNMQENRTVDTLTANFILPSQNVIADNITCEVNVSIDGIKNIRISLSGSRISSSTDNYCEDNPGVCIGVPVVVAVAVLIILVILLLLFACPDSRRMFLALLHQNSKTSVVSKSNTAENEYVAVTEAPHTNVQPSGESDTISLQNTDTVVAAANERPKYVKVTLSDNLPIHIPPNNLVSYAQIQH